MKLLLYPIASLVLLCLGRLFSHHLMFGWSIACLAVGLACLVVFAWKCDKQSSTKR